MTASRGDERRMNPSATQLPSPAATGGDTSQPSAPSGAVQPLSAAIMLAPPVPDPGDVVARRIGVVAALAGHATIAALLMWATIPAFIGGGGSDLDTIGIDIIPSTALDSLTANARGAAASRSTISQTAGAEQASDTATPAADRREDDAKTQPEPAAQQPDLVLPDWQRRPEPADPEALRLSIGPERTPVAEEAEAAAAAQQSAANPSQAAPSAEAAVTGSEAAQASEARSDPRAAQAATAAGSAITEYNRELIGVLGQLRQHVEKAAARLQGATRGKLVLQLTIAADGGTSEITIASSSGNRQLDERAIAAVQSFRFPPPPRLASAADRTYRLPITFR